MNSDKESIIDEAFLNQFMQAKNSSKANKGDKDEDNPKRERIFRDGGEDSFNEFLDEPLLKESTFTRKRRKTRYDDEYYNTKETETKNSPASVKFSVEDEEKQISSRHKEHEKQIPKAPDESEHELDPLCEVLEYLAKENRNFEGVYLVLEDPEAAQFFKLQILKNRVKIEEGTVNSCEQILRDYRTYSDVNEAITKAKEEILFRAEAGYHLKMDKFNFTLAEWEPQADSNIDKMQDEVFSKKHVQAPIKTLTQAGAGAAYRCKQKKKDKWEKKHPISCPLIITKKGENKKLYDRTNNNYYLPILPNPFVAYQNEIYQRKCSQLQATPPVKVENNIQNQTGHSKLLVSSMEVKHRWDDLKWALGERLENINPETLQKNSIGGQAAEGRSEKTNECKRCTICMDKFSDIAFIPCGHKMTCSDCSQKIIKNKGVCPICSQNITSSLKVYES